MTEVHITLYSDDAAWFKDIQDDIRKERDGNEPSNAETLRLLMEESDRGSRNPRL